jgi:hypothetical protein
VSKDSYDCVMQDWIFASEKDLFFQLPSFTLRLYKNVDARWCMSCVNMNVRNLVLVSSNLEQVKREAVEVLRRKINVMKRDVEKINF